jgi:hypothetical protein
LDNAKVRWISDQRNDLDQKMRDAAVRQILCEEYSLPRIPSGVNLHGWKRNNTYEVGLAALREDTLWADTRARDSDEMGDGEEAATADVEGLRRFLEGEVLPGSKTRGAVWFENREKELANRPLIREHAFGEALDPDKLDGLGRYEIHLDCKLERMLTMLLRLKELRRGDGPP